jgi:hypothetical protein
MKRPQYLICCQANLGPVKVKDGGNLTSFSVKQEIVHSCEFNVPQISPLDLHEIGAEVGM